MTLAWPEPICQINSFDASIEQEARSRPSRSTQEREEKNGPG